MDEIIVGLLNELEITDFNCENGFYYNIYARNDIKTQELLWLLYANESELNSTENSIDILPLANKYIEKFDGSVFIPKAPTNE